MLEYFLVQFVWIFIFSIITLNCLEELCAIKNSLMNSYKWNSLIMEILHILSKS